MEQFINIHLFFVAALGLLELAYLLFSQLLRDLHKYIFRIRVLLPAYYLAYALVFFTGLLLAASAGFEPSSIKRWLPLVINFALSIYQFILFKRARKSKNFTAFKRSSLILESLKIILFILAGVRW